MPNFIHSLLTARLGNLPPRRAGQWLLPLSLLLAVASLALFLWSLAPAALTYASPVVLSSSHLPHPVSHLLSSAFSLPTSNLQLPISNLQPLTSQYCTPPLCLDWSSTESGSTVSMAWGDYDGDGDLDLAVGNDGQPNRVYRNDNGTLTASAVWSSTESDNTSSVAWGDYDGDGDLDLAVGNYNNQPNRLYRNDGGTLTASAVWSSIESGSTISVAWGDYDGDGDLDLAVGNYGQPNRLYRNDNGTLTASAVWSSTESDATNSVAWGDYDGDGDLDLVVGNYGQPNRLYRNNNGTLTAGAVWSSTESDRTTSVAWGDYDGDGDLDLAVGNRYYYDDGCSCYVGQPNRLYRNDAGVLTASAVWSSTESDDTFSVAWGDYDGDGDLDLAVGNNGQPNRLYRNGNGVLTASAVWSSTENDLTISVAWGDYDGDGDLDLAVGNANQPNRLYRNDGGVLPASAVYSTTESDWTESVAWGDYDGDGDLDLAVGNYNGQPDRLYRNDNGTLTASAVWSSTESDDTTSVAWGDYDGDGDLDLAVGNDGQPNRLYRNDNGMLTASAVWSSTESDGTASVAWGDYDGDGDLDLAVGNYSGPNRLYRSNGGTLTASAAWSSTESDDTFSVAWGDYDGDGDLDLAVGNWGQPNRLYRNDGGTLTASAVWSSTESDDTTSVAWGDYDGDGDLDLAVGNSNYATGCSCYIGAPNRLYRNDGGVLTPSAVWSSIESDRTYSLAWGDYDGDGDLDLAVGNWKDPNRLYRNDNGTLTTGAVWSSTESDATQSVAWGDVDGDGDLDLAVGNYNGQINRLYRNTRDGRSLPGSIPTVRVARPVANADGYSSPHISSGVIPITYTLSDSEGDPVRAIRAEYSINGGGQWLPAMAASGTITANLTTTNTYIYNWDTFASGFFGQSDNVVFRIEAVPAIVTNTQNATPGPYLYGSYASTTFPFRVRGTQVRVMNQNGTVAANAIAYRLKAGQQTGGALIGNATAPFHTDNNGYLQGRGTLNISDTLLALVPITGTGSYTLYYTSGTPNETGLTATSVLASGVQTLTVSAAHPLYLFNVEVALEWDASHDANYLDQIQFNLQRAADYLYDFTNGEATLGQVIVTQNADDWAYANVLIRANNRIRPFSAQGGIVLTETVDPQHSDILYEPGQLTIGSTWNRYGTPGVSIGDDWAIILAHELSHYLFFHDDTYLGLDANGNLIPVSTCKGSAMGDIYGDPDATEFIADETYWLANCGQTLPQVTLGRNEWETMQLWYPSLITPTVINPGPSLVPFDLTTISLTAPLTPTNALDDPTFYLDYFGGGVSSTEARAYLLRNDQFIIDVGSPFGGQNRVLARGAQPGDRLCIFDRPVAQFGCEIIAEGDDRIQMKQIVTWTPVIQMNPVNSTTLGIQVSLPTSGLNLQGRLFPEYGDGTATITLAEISGVYSGTFNLNDVTMAGHVQLWVQEGETATETNPRREAIVAFSIGGNPGALRAGGGALRAGGGALRAGGGALRAGGGALRAGGAPVISPDGQMIFFTENPMAFQPGQFYTIQGMAGLPSVPPGREVVGQGYSLMATPGTPVLTGSVSIQYLSNDVVNAGATEDQLTLYFYSNGDWMELPTNRDEYFNVATAPGQGVGIYALMASAQIPLYAAGWNLIAYPVQTTQSVTQALLSISGYYTTVYGYVVTDTLNHWRVYDINAPSWVNDLTTLEYGHGYWINASQAITLHLAPKAPTNVYLPAPPATFYGTVHGEAAFTPAAGQAVTAWVNGTLCGQGLTQWIEGELVYALDVPSECAAPGQWVTFRVNGREMAQRALWDNSQVSELALTPGNKLYLPLIAR